MYKYFILKLSACLMMVFVSQIATAEPITQCPGQEELKNFQSVFAVPYAYSASHQKIAYLSVSAEKINDSTNAWVMFLNPVYADQHEDIYHVINSTVPLFKPVSVTPFEFRPEANNPTKVQFCAYDLPGSTGMQALIYYIDLDEESDEVYNAPDFKNKIAHHAKVKKIIKQMMLQ